IPIGVNWTVIGIGALMAWSLAGRFLPGEAPGLSATAYWLAGAGVALLFLASLLAHELAHAIVARRDGIEVEGITLWLLGGVAKLRGEARTPGAEARIAIVGPLTSLAIAGAAFLVATAVASLQPSGDAALVVAAARWLAVVNLVLGIFNLIPGAPLDGGRIARAIVWKVRGDALVATRAASGLGRMVGWGLAGLGIAEVALFGNLGGLWSILLGWFIAGAATAEREQAETLHALDGVTVADVMTRDPLRTPAALTVDAFVDHVAPGSRSSTWVLTGPGGDVVSVLGLESIRRLGRGRARETRLAELATPIAQLPVASPDESVPALLARIASAPATTRVVVMDDGLLVGLLLPEDLSRAIEVGRLRPGSRIDGGPRSASRPVPGWPARP
ncbi:MAG: site-2 protease family protein, partial [Chloroflexi bacterium]|nr:site-2 protease family protein [Chloroflexota bacterium]